MSGTGEMVAITGASGGVGRRAAARQVASEGARIGLTARGRKGLEGTARDVKQAGGEALILPCDVADADQVEAAAASAVEETFGPIDIWGAPGPFDGQAHSRSPQYETVKPRGKLLVAASAVLAGAGAGAVIANGR